MTMLMIQESIKAWRLQELLNIRMKNKNYSLGMKQRLGIAIAILSNPNVVILDEPFNGLDVEGMVKMRELIIRLSKQYKTTFFYI